MPVLSQKAINILKVMRGGKPVIAVWSHPELNMLESARLAISTYAVAPTGKIHTSRLWTITDEGQAFLRNERGGL